MTFFETTLTVEPCGREGARLYMTGLCCPQCTPAAINGRPEVVVDPELTMEALQRKAGKRIGFSQADTSLVDGRALRSGRRAAGRRSYLRTRKAIAEGDSASRA